MTTCFLRVGSDYLDDAIEFFSVQSAVQSFERTARDLGRYGQTVEATIHIAKTREELTEYPDYVLSLGPRGGLKKEIA